MARVFVTLHGGPLDGLRRAVSADAREAWLMHPQTDRRYRYALDCGVWRYDP